MKRTNAITLLAVAFVGTGFTSLASEQKPKVKKQTTCPVMSGQINKAQYADVKGKRIYVCCKGCISKIEADPDKYIKQLEAEGITLDQADKKK